MKKAELAEKACRVGKEYEKTYTGCSQCVIAALQDALEIRNDDIFRAATGLAGGTGLAGDSGCGVYIGAILVLSSLDYDLPDPQEYEKFHNAGAHDVHCPEVVGKAAKWMTEIISKGNRHTSKEPCSQGGL
jgi:hypothetical protein